MEKKVFTSLVAEKIKKINKIKINRNRVREGRACSDCNFSGLSGSSVICYSLTPLVKRTGREKHVEIGSWA